jgi:hypothetical protein
MESVETCLCLGINIGPLLVKVFYSLQIAHVSCIQKGRKPFFIFLVEPLDDLLSVIFFVNFIQALLKLGLFTTKLDGMVNVELDNIKVILICQFV